MVRRFLDGGTFKNVYMTSYISKNSVLLVVRGLTCYELLMWTTRRTRMKLRTRACLVTN